MRPKSAEKEEAIRTIALQIIADEGLENLSMQKLAAAANISPRTIYIKYENKEDLLIRLFIDDVLGAYETAVLEGFHPDMELGEGVKKIWSNTFHYLKNNEPHFVLMQYGKSSPLLNKAYAARNIRQGQFFAPVHSFLKKQVRLETVRALPFDVHRALLFAPLFDLVQEYFDHKKRARQIITEKIIMECCDAVIKGVRF